jgi:hypothetical protein
MSISGEYHFPTGSRQSEYIPSYNISLNCHDMSWRIKNVVPMMCNIGEPATLANLNEWGRSKLYTTAEVDDITFAYSSKFYHGFLRPQPHISIGAKTNARFVWVNRADIENRLSQSIKGKKSPLVVMAGPRFNLKTNEGQIEVNRFITETMGRGLLFYPHHGFISPSSDTNNQIIKTGFNQVSHGEILHWIRRRITDYQDTEKFVTDAFYNPALSCGINMTLRQYAAGKHSIVQPGLPRGVNRSKNNSIAPKNIQINDVFAI